MYISPENRLSDKKIPRPTDLSCRYGRLLSGVRLNRHKEDGTIRKSKRILSEEARCIFETRSTIQRLLDRMPEIHYWISRKRDQEGVYWHIQIHPVCAILLDNLQYLDKSFGGDIRFNVSLKELGK